MGPGQKILIQVGPIFCCLGRISHLWFGFGFGKYPLKISNSAIFSLRVKKISSGQKVTGSRMGQLLIYCVSKLYLGRFGSGPISINIKDFTFLCRLDTKPGNFRWYMGYCCWLSWILLGIYSMYVLSLMQLVLTGKFKFDPR